MGKTKYIDAEAFKRRILSYGIVYEGDRIPIPFYKHYFAKAYVAILRWVCEEVDDTPSAADVEEVRHGRWIENETSYADPPTKQTCNCSICGKASTRPLGDWCRWCGAKMDEVEE